MAEKTAAGYAVWLLEKRDYSEKELFKKISGKYSEKEAAEAVAKMIDFGYVDDRKYARRLAEKYFASYGKKRVSEELYKRGIDREIAAVAIEETYNRETTAEKISALIKIKTKGNFPEDRKERDKLFAFLCRKGFSSGEIADALRRLKEEIYDGDFTEQEDYGN